MKLIKRTLKLPAKLTLTPESVEQQKSLVESAKTVSLPTNATEQQHAVSIGQDLRRHLNEIEKSRKEHVAPALEWQRLVNKLAKELREPEEAQLDRIEGLVNDYQKTEAERVRREEAERAAQLQRLQAPVDTNGDVSMQELAAYRQEQAVEELIREPLPEPEKATGAATRQVMRWKCTDPHALYLARPDLCTAPEPKPSAIQALCVPGVEIPGLVCWYETETVIRSR